MNGMLFHIMRKERKSVRMLDYRDFAVHARHVNILNEEHIIR